MKKILSLMICCLLLCSCGNDKKTEDKIVVENITCSEMYELVDDGAILVDVRTIAEYNSGHLDNAINLPVETIADTIETEISDKDKKIVLYCRSGNRSATAAQTLIDMGYKNVYDMGGMNTCTE